MKGSRKSKIIITGSAVLFSGLFTTIVAEGPAETAPGSAPETVAPAIKEDVTAGGGAAGREGFSMEEDVQRAVKAENPTTTSGSSADASSKSGGPDAVITNSSSIEEIKADIAKKLDETKEAVSKNVDKLQFKIKPQQTPDHMEATTEGDSRVTTAFKSLLSYIPGSSYFMGSSSPAEPKKGEEEGEAKTETPGEKEGEAKTETPGEKEGEAKTEASGEIKPVSQGEAKPVGQSETQTEASGEIKPVGQGEAKPVGQSETQTEASGEIKPVGQGEAKPVGQSETQTEASGEIKPVGQGEAKPVGQSETQTEAPGEKEGEAKTESQAEKEGEIKPVGQSETQTEASGEIKPVGQGEKQAEVKGMSKEDKRAAQQDLQKTIRTQAGFVGALGPSGSAKKKADKKRKEREARKELADTQHTQAGFVGAFDENEPTQSSKEDKAVGPSSDEGAGGSQEAPKPEGRSDTAVQTSQESANQPSQEELIRNYMETTGKTEEEAKVAVGTTLTLLNKPAQAPQQAAEEPSALNPSASQSAPAKEKQD
ncbi:hypothetical protein NEHOM01_1354 [Nematocida homosporus]|uniref:uncharacterized protein n=1 Tax=Nematocida homosporus TaxID=1912981 RepID=UPI00221F93EA|nr:uncharacterized protein NEHOM01_1354 [Nematocida homosporus]KAI5186265.1 hypothetical protein NEHOM01_1354 [Nematocida homosporus]